MTKTGELEIEIAYSDSFTEALRSGNVYAETPLTISSSGSFLRTPEGDRFEVSEFIITLIPRLLQASVDVLNGNEVMLEFHSTSVALSFRPDSENVSIRAHIGSEVGPPLDTTPDALRTGCSATAEEFLDFINTTSPELACNKKVTQIEEMVH